MEKVRIEDVDGWMGPAAEKKPVSRALGTEHVAIIYYELDTDESMAFGYHRHEKQEEVFYVQEGTVTFETDEGDVAVGPGELARFAPGEWQRGTNRSAERATVLAVGAPRDGGETTILRECPECGEQTPQEITRGPEANALVTRCVECRAETGRFS